MGDAEWQACDLEALRLKARAFAVERDWEQYHDIRSLLLALVSETGEAADLVRWRRDCEFSLSDDLRSAWNDELADIFILLVRLADVSGVDLGAAFQSKLAKAGQKYPAEACRGSNDKYTAYESSGGGENGSNDTTTARPPR
jgi:NTP pyrophosphatase (non-canonical NTP hydrolase)